MSHYITKCSCGVVISQCRCMGEKPVTIIEKGCVKCRREYQKEKDKETYRLHEENYTLGDTEMARYSDFGYDPTEETLRRTRKSSESFTVSGMVTVGGTPPLSPTEIDYQEGLARLEEREKRSRRKDED